MNIRASYPHRAASTVAFVGYLTLQLTLSYTFAAASKDGVWLPVAETSLVGNPGERWIVPKAYKTFHLDRSALERILSQAPPEQPLLTAGSAPVLMIPMPDGEFSRFAIFDSPIMEAPLSAAFPDLRTYRGQGLDDPTATVRLDWTPAGFHAMVLSADGTVFVDPYRRGDVENYISYEKSDFVKQGDIPHCLGSLEEPRDDGQVGNHSRYPAGGLESGLGLALRSRTRAEALVAPIGDKLRTFRLAVAATGEFTAFHGGTVSAGLSAVTTSINRVTGIYERELAVRFTLVANESAVIYTDPSSDPYTNSNPDSLLAENQANLDSVIGSANYDIGHVFGTGGGGLASLGVVCVSGSKARGETGSSSPVGDPFDVDFVAHEIGHEFGARHSFNGTTGNCGGGNRSPASAYEPGSGSTIMGYAGICGAENLQPHSDDYFHTQSYDEITANIASGSATCSVQTTTGNSAPTVDAGANFTIPIFTPFTLSASGSDPNGDALTYCWEELDLGTESPPYSDDGSRPLFRSFGPVASPSRTFPKLSDILLGISCRLGECLPTTGRTMTFRVTARDNRGSGGGIHNDAMQVTSTTSSGPFFVSQPNTTGVTWPSGSIQTVLWIGANTREAPVGTANVKISLSTDGGNTFPTVLAASTPNDGSEAITVPETFSTTARIKIEAIGNIFFDISDADFTITCNSSIASNLSATPSSGTAPLTIDLRASTSGSATGTINYTFWYNCSDPGTIVNNVMTTCGTIPTPQAGTCASNSIGTKCDGVTDIPKTISHTYSSPGTYSAKVIIERGCASPAESRVPVNVTSLPAVIWTTQPPPSRTAGQQFSVGWTASGSFDHVNVHWNPTDPTASLCCLGPASSTNDSTLSPTVSPVTLVAPSLNQNGTPITAPTTVKYVVHVRNSTTGDAAYSAVIPVTVNPPSTPLPTVTTGSASSVTSTTATLGGTVNPNGSGTTVYFEWSPNTNLSNPTTSPPQGVGMDSSSVPVSASISNLSAGTTYYYRLVATNTGGVARGAVLSFTTAGAVAIPTVTTGAASAVTSNSATIGGAVNPNGSDTTIHFEWSTDPALPSPFTSPPLGVGPGTSTVPVSANIASLSGSTTYYYRIVATNSGGTARGAVASFTTAVQSPVANFLLDRYSIDFGTVPIGNSPSAVIIITNPSYSTGTLTGNVGSPPAPFSVVVGAGAFSLAPGQSKDVAIQFTPTSPGTFSSGFQITHNAAGSPANISLTGIGQSLTVGIQVSPNPIVFSNVSAGGSATQDFTITNPAGSTGNLNGTISGLVSPFDFCCNPNFAIGPGGSDTIHVRFLPTSQGEFSGTLTLTHNAYGSPTTVPVIGRTAITRLLVSPTAVNFGNAHVGQCVYQTVTITNDPNSTASVSGDLLSSDYGNPQAFVLQSGSTNFNLSPGQSTSDVIGFCPPLSGSFSGTLVVKPADRGVTTNVPLTGTNDTSFPGLFTSTATSFAGVGFSALAWGDYDNDGDLDLVLTGLSGGQRIAKIYRNDGGGTFSDIGAALMGVNAGNVSSVAWGDYDNDGDLDLVISGYTGNAFATTLYRNDGGVFTNAGIPLVGVGSGSLAWGDYDNDGDLDLVVSGITDSQSPTTRIYRNDGNGVFVDTGISLIGFGSGSVAWGDLDNDGDLDLVVTGSDSSGARTAKVYRNDGNGVFTDIGTPLTAVSNGAVALGDYDNDGDLDILLTGNSATGKITKIYRNDGGGVFTEAASLVAVVGSAAWCDYDNDGDLDAVVTGFDNVTGVSTRVYRNDGSGGGFVDIGAWLAGTYGGSLACGDYDNDGRVDIALAEGSGGSTTRLYRNNTPTPDTAPAPPSNPASAVRGNSVILSWDAGGDSQTPANGLGYNLRVGTHSGATEVVTPMAAANGYRRLPKLGNANQARMWRIKNLPVGTYYWGVQALDSAFVGSSFTSEHSFAVTTCLDFDGDGYGSPGDPACAAGALPDCNDGDPSVVAAPPEVQALRWSNNSTLAWDSVGPSAGSGTVHDVLRGAVAELPVGNKPSETCLAPGVAGAMTMDSATPAAGRSFWYLVRGRNVCGMGAYGYQSNGSTRISAVCP